MQWPPAMRAFSSSIHCCATAVSWQRAPVPRAHTCMPNRSATWAAVMFSGWTSFP